MRRTSPPAALIALIFSFCSLFLFPKVTYGIETKIGISVIDNIQIKKDSDFKYFPASFCVTEDGYYLVPDRDSCQVKVFEQNGDTLELLDNFGPTGLNDSEFYDPVFCFYSKHDLRFGVVDIDKKRGEYTVHIFEHITGMTRFEPEKKIENAFGYDLKLDGSGKRLIVAGYFQSEQNKTYGLYTIDLTTNQKSPLLPAYKKYDLANENEYQVEFRKKTLQSIGRRAYIDTVDDYAYFVWEGKLKITKIDLKTNREQKSFQHKTNHYKQPLVSKTLLMARENKDSNKVKEEKNRMSLVRGIFATSRHVLVVYKTAKKYRLQIYSVKGKFLGETAIPGTSNLFRVFFFDRENYKLYSLIEKPKKGMMKMSAYKVTVAK